MSRPQRIELLLFIACFFAFAYFNQGGGWNQNSRFAEVRAMAEEGRFAIDDYLIYKRESEGGDLVRIPTQRAEYTYQGQRFRLCWVDMEWNLFPIGEAELGPDVKKSAMISDCSSGDLAYVDATGHFHPNKPPGTSFLAVPGYFVAFHVEKALGINPDSWWALQVNSWLASVCSVGLISAIGCVLFFRIAREMSGALLPALLATFVFAFGTTFFPFSTLLFDHDLTASFLIAAFYFLRGARQGGVHRSLLAGFCAGMAVLTNLVSAIAVVLLGLYALFEGTDFRSGTAFVRSLAVRRALGYIVGGIFPALALAAFNHHCFGGALNLATNFQSPLFKDEGAFLGMFVLPHDKKTFWDWIYVIKAITYSPFRGIFWFSPVLLFGFVGIAVWLRSRRWADALLCFSVAASFFAVNSLFNGYHAGFSAGPRYLIPGIPFFALPLVVVFRWWPWITGAFASLSIAVNLLLTVTDAQNPAGVGGHARVEKTRPDSATYNLITEYAWPLFAYGNARPLLQEQMQLEIRKVRTRIAAETEDPLERTEREQEERAGLQEAINQGSATPFLLASIRGPVSVNPMGIYEGLMEYRLFPPGSPPCQWASFNVGEFLWPNSRWSLLPLFLVSGGLAAWAIFFGRREDLRNGLALEPA